MILERTDAAVDRLAVSLADGPRQVDLYPVGRAGSEGPADRFAQAVRLRARYQR
jgi:hypothetical protein